jgi:Ca2+-binding RTX toxin-like protein
LFGGKGDDKLEGGDLSDVLIGGAGQDELKGKKGDDILIAGGGKDKLDGDKGKDILIAGSTIYDDNDLASLCDIQKEWLRIDNLFADRVDHLFRGGGRNGTAVLDGATVQVVDGLKDKLKGGSGTDWFLADIDPDSDEDKIGSLKEGEALLDADGLLTFEP